MLPAVASLIELESTLLSRQFLVGWSHTVLRALRLSGRGRAGIAALQDPLLMLLLCRRDPVPVCGCQAHAGPEKSNSEVLLRV